MFKKKGIYRFQGKFMYLVYQQYQNNRPALSLHQINGDIWCYITYDVPHLQLGPKELTIKTWNENEGIMDFLVLNGITTDAKSYYTLNENCTVAIVDLLIDL